jgi:hypothetical protein
MNCAQHTGTAAVAYCRSCGKALCEACKREVQGTIFCEPCLAARIHPGTGGNFGAGYGAGGGAARAPEDASPGLALFLGFIPGVGAFYNGQFLKGFVHVIVMSTLIWMSDHGMGAFAGLLIGAWFFYMVFDAYTTAKARRDGLPIPDPIGLNAILEGREGTFRERVEQAGERLGTHVEYAAQNIGQQWKKAGGAAPGASNPAAGNSGAGTTPGADQPPPGPQTAASGPQGTYYSGPQGTYYSGPEGTVYVPPKQHEHSPMGAVVLIGLGVLFLLANLGWFSFHWFGNFWPLLLIVIGVWLFIQRRRGVR